MPVVPEVGARRDHYNCGIYFLSAIKEMSLWTANLVVFYWIQMQSTAHLFFLQYNSSGEFS